MSYIELTDVSVVFDEASKTIQVFDNLSLSIEKGDFISLVGSSGCGKSTLLRLIGGLVKPAKGRVRVGDVTVNELDGKDEERYRNQKIGFVFQNFCLIDCFNVVENVMTPALIAGVPPVEARARAMELLSEVGLSDRASSYPNKMSGGEQQRVAVARALINNSDLILADEPTGNLDSVARDAVLAILKRLNAAGKTILLVTHDEVVASFAKRSLCVDDLKGLSKAEPNQGI